MKLNMVILLFTLLPMTTIAKSVDGYINDFQYLSCYGIKNKQSDLKKKYVMASKNGKKRINKQLKALKKLKKANRC
ncbi:hypothetical protein A3K86_03100 [Photobacterium jeanii]|uniref:Uncharacterized protein n=1 Tax=Photobacterium jeanii TaxID=858640 RepID=A0A178KKR8_9GAMM|nr:hypothetical protein [Photobacterium jeanii]OAN17919.1 hypothetical protein A3K86_03100 [Photobacterium jeanii]PST92411.1 hypothetical protein C9I91_04350 [Photobacterium jeanii]